MVVAPRYDCTLCPRTDLLLQEMQEAGRVRKRDGKPAASWCKQCAARRHRAYYARDPEAVRAKCRADYRFRRRVAPDDIRRQDNAARRRRKEREPERQQQLEDARQRRYREKLRADPERHERRKHNLRIANRERAIAQGRDPASIKGRLRQGGQGLPGKTMRVPAQPVWAVAQRYLALSGMTREAFADATGVSDRTLRRWENGQRTADYTVADRVLVYLSLLPHDVWDGAE